MSSEFCFIYTTFPSKELAKELANEIVELKLAACANLFEGMESIYSWHGKIESAQEVMVLFKTRKVLTTKLEEKLLEKHPYDRPCLVHLPISGGHSPYLQWLKSQTES